MKKHLFTILILSFGFNLFSQSQSAKNKIESARIAFISQRLDLTPQEAEKFWPIYREYSKQREQLKREYMDARQEFKEEGITEAESEKLLEIGFSLKEKELQLDKEYSERLTKVISSRQLLALRKAEEDFRKMLLERLKERGEERDRINNKRLRNNN